VQCTLTRTVVDARTLSPCRSAQFPQVDGRLGFPSECCCRSPSRDVPGQMSNRTKPRLALWVQTCSEALRIGNRSNRQVGGQDMDSLDGVIEEVELGAQCRVTLLGQGL
jgi:hypothetical protein